MRIPKYIQIKDKILADIRDKKLNPGDRLPTREELIAEYGVARTTIARVFEELDRLGVVQGQRGSGTYVASLDISLKICIISSHKEKEYNNKQEPNDLAGMFNSMINSNGEMHLDFLGEGVVLKNSKVLDDYDAAVWVQPDDETMKKISGLKNKVIVTNRYPDDLNFVSTNHRQAINEVTKHYITNCDKKSQIFFLSHDDQSFVMRQRKEGFIKACSEFQRFYRICEVGYSYDEIFGSLLDLPLDTKKPIIMISPSCNLTGAVLSMAKERGLEINKNLFYADFDNIMSLQLSGVRISTVLQNYAEMGRVVMDSIKLLGKKPVQVFVPYKIIGLETE